MLSVVVLIGLGFCGIVVALVLRDVYRGYVELIARARRAPRYQMGALFGLVTVACIASALSRPAILSDADVPVWLITASSLLLAIGVVFGTLATVFDVYESYTTRQRRIAAEPRRQGANRQTGHNDERVDGRNDFV